MSDKSKSISDIMVMVSDPSHYIQILAMCNQCFVDIYMSTHVSSLSYILSYMNHFLLNGKS